MNICVISPSYPTSKTIVFAFVDQLCRAFADHGIEVSIIAPLSVSRCIVHHEPLVRFHTRIKTEKGNVIDLYRPKYLSFGRGKLSKYSGFNSAIRRGFKKLKCKPDALYGHFWSSIYAALPISQEFNIPLFGASGEENVSFYDIYSLEQKHLLSTQIKGLVNVSTKNRDECISLGMIDKSKTIVIPNGANLSLFYSTDRERSRKILNVTDDDFVVGFMGQFVPRKGVMRLNNALKTLDDPCIKAMFIGAGVEEPDYERVVYKGRLDHNEIPQFLSACDVFVLPTENEGCSNAIVEALACGLPVISTDAAFNYDILNKDNSLLIDTRDESLIAEAIERLKGDNILRKHLSEGARKMSKGLSLEKRAERILCFIKERI